MKAIYLTQYGESSTAFETRDAETPIPKTGELVIQVHSFGLNFADVMARRGIYREAPPLPALLGYDVAGTVHAIGKGVDGFEIGQRVAALTRFGGYAQYAATQASGVISIPDQMDFATATILATQGSTAWYNLNIAALIFEADHVLIHAAAGGVGKLMVDMAKAKNCTVYGTASTSKQAYLNEIGVDFPIDYTKAPFDKTVKKLPNFKGFDLIVDNIGGKTFRKGAKLLKPTGKIISYGAAAQNQGNKTGKLQTIKVGLGFGFFSPIPLIMRSQSVIGVNMLRVAEYKPQQLTQSMLAIRDLILQGVVKPVVGKIFKADNIAEAHHWLESRQSVGKIVMEW